MKKLLKYFKYLVFAIAFLFSASVVYASILTVPQGGTSVNTITGIIKGNGTAPFSVAIPGVDFLAGSIAPTQVGFGSATSSVTSDPNFTWTTNGLTVFSNAGFPSDWGNIQSVISSDGSEAGLELSNTGAGGLNYSLISTSNSSGIGGGQFSIGDATDGQNFFQYDSSIGQTKIRSYGIEQLEVSDNTGFQKLGDIGCDWYCDLLNINGPSRVTTIEDEGNPYLSIDKNNNKYQLGDINNTNGGTVANVNDNAGVFAVLGQFQTINGLNLDFPDRYYTLGEGVSPVGPYLQVGGNTQNIVGNGNVNLGGTLGQGLNINFASNQYGIGDLSLLHNNTSISLDDNLSVQSFNGNKGAVYNLVGFTGTGLDDLTYGGMYTGVSNDNYNTWIDSFGNYTVTYTPPSSPSGLALSGLVTDGTTGATANVVSDDTFGTMLLTGETGGAINPTDVLTDGSGNSVTVDTSTQTPDTFAWTDTLGGSGSMILTDISPVTLSNGINVVWGATTGHDIGSPTASWEEDITISFGRMMALDGQNNSMAIGDVDGVGNGTNLVVQDQNFYSYPINRWVGGMGSSLKPVANLELPTNGNKFHLTTGGTVFDIGTTNWTDGSEIVLYFDLPTTLRHNIAPPPSTTAPMELAGSSNFIGVAKCNITLMYDKHNPVSAAGAWDELSRTCP